MEKKWFAYTRYATGEKLFKYGTQAESDALVARLNRGQDEITSYVVREPKPTEAYVILRELDGTDAKYSLAAALDSLVDPAPSNQDLIGAGAGA